MRYHPKVSRALIIIIVLAAWATALSVYPHLPATVISHWNANGVPNGSLSRFWGDFLFPLLMTALFALYLIFPKLEPLRRNLESFRSVYDLLWTLILAFLAYLYALVLGANFGWRVDFASAAMTGYAFLIFVIGTLLPYMKRNWFIGIRTPWTLSSDAVWKKTHEAGSIFFELAALAIAAGVFFAHYRILFVLIPIIAAALISIVYSYVVYQKQKTSA